MSDDEYNNKLKNLQRFIPFLENMISQLKDPGKKNREQQLSKMESLYAMITDKRKKLKLETLTKCEDVISKLFNKVQGQTKMPNLKVPSSVTIPPNSIIAQNQRLTPQTQGSGTGHPISVSNRPVNIQRPKVSNREETPASPSPDREISSGIPLLIPTEKVQRSSASYKNLDRTSKPRVDIYFKAAETLQEPKRDSVFNRLGYRYPDMSKPPISLDDGYRYPDMSKPPISLEDLESLEATVNVKYSSQPGRQNSKDDLKNINTTVRNNTTPVKKPVSISPHKNKHKTDNQPQSTIDKDFFDIESKHRKESRRTAINKEKSELNTMLERDKCADELEEGEIKENPKPKESISKDGKLKEAKFKENKLEESSKSKYESPKPSVSDKDDNISTSGSPKKSPKVEKVIKDSGNNVFGSILSSIDIQILEKKKDQKEERRSSTSSKEEKKEMSETKGAVEKVDKPDKAEAGSKESSDSDKKLHKKHKHKSKERERDKDKSREHEKNQVKAKDNKSSKHKHREHSKDHQKSDKEHSKSLTSEPTSIVEDKDIESKAHRTDKKNKLEKACDKSRGDKVSTNQSQIKQDKSEVAEGKLNSSEKKSIENQNKKKSEASDMKVNLTEKKSSVNEKTSKAKVVDVKVDSTDRKSSENQNKLESKSVPSTKTEVQATSFKRLADKYNPKPRKQVTDNLAVSKVVTDSIENNMKMCPPKIPFLDDTSKSDVPLPSPFPPGFNPLENISKISEGSVINRIMSNPENTSIIDDVVNRFTQNKTLINTVRQIEPQVNMTTNINIDIRQTNRDLPPFNRNLSNLPNVPVNAALNSPHFPFSRNDITGLQRKALLPAPVMPPLISPDCENKSYNGGQQLTQNNFGKQQPSGQSIFVPTPQNLGHHPQSIPFNPFDMPIENVPLLQKQTFVSNTFNFTKPQFSNIGGITPNPYNESPMTPNPYGSLPSMPVTPNPYATDSYFDQPNCSFNSFQRNNRDEMNPVLNRRISEESFLSAEQDKINFELERRRVLDNTKDPRFNRDPRNREFRDPRDIWDARDNRNINFRDPRDYGKLLPFSRDPRENRDPRNRDPMEMSRDPRDRDSRDPRLNRVWDVRDNRERNRDPRQQFRDPREVSRDPREVSRDPREVSRDPREISRDPRELSRDPRELSRDPREVSRDPRDNSRDQNRDPHCFRRDPRDRDYEDRDTFRDLRDVNHGSMESKDSDKHVGKDRENRPRFQETQDSRSRSRTRYDRDKFSQRRDRSRSRSKSRHRESFISPLDSLYHTNESVPKTGKGYGVQAYRMKKGEDIKRSAKKGTFEKNNIIDDDSDMDVDNENHSNTTNDETQVEAVETAESLPSDIVKSSEKLSNNVKAEEDHPKLKIQDELTDLKTDTENINLAESKDKETSLGDDTKEQKKATYMVNSSHEEASATKTPGDNNGDDQTDKNDTKMLHESTSETGELVKTESEEKKQAELETCKPSGSTAAESILAQFFANFMGNANKKDKKGAFLSLISTFSDSFSDQQIKLITNILNKEESSDEEPQSTTQEEHVEDDVPLAQIKKAKLESSKETKQWDESKSTVKRRKPGPKSKTCPMYKRPSRKVSESDGFENIEPATGCTDVSTTCVSEKKNAKKLSDPGSADEHEDTDNLDQVIVSVGERTKNRKRKTLSPSHQTRHRKRSELDKLHEDIQDMFIRDGVLTATGKRMCSLIKNDLGALDNKPKPSKTKTAVETDEKRKTRSVAKLTKQDVEMPVLMDVRVLLPKMPVDDGKRYSLRHIARKPSYAETDNSEVVKSETTTDIDSLYTSTSDVSSILEKSIVQKHNLTLREEPKQTKINKKRKVKSSWASGVIKKKKRKNSFSHDEKYETESNSEPPQLELAEEFFEKEEKPPEIAIPSDDQVKTPVKIRKKPGPKPKQKQLPKPDIKPDNEENSIEPSKDYYWKYNNVMKCLLCPVKCKALTSHYRFAHPDSEVFISRLSVTQVEEALKRVPVIETSCDSETPVRQNYCCIFCSAKMRNSLALQFYDHLSMHTGEYRFCCLECSFATHSRKVLSTHHLNVHSPLPRKRIKFVKPSISQNIFGYLCTDCNFIQMDKIKVENHVKTYHLNNLEKIVKICMSTLDEKETYENSTNKDQEPDSASVECNNTSNTSVEDTDNHPEMNTEEAKERPNLHTNEEGEEPKLSTNEKNEMPQLTTNKENKNSELSTDKESKNLEEDVFVNPTGNENDNLKEDPTPQDVKTKSKRKMKKRKMSSQYLERDPKNDVAQTKDDSALENTSADKVKSITEKSQTLTTEEIESKPTVVQPNTSKEENSDRSKGETENKEKEKQIELNVFTCATDTYEDEQIIDKERLKTMEELNKSVKINRNCLDFIEKLSSKLTSGANKNNESVSIKQEPVSEETPLQSCQVRVFDKNKTSVDAGHGASTDILQMLKCTEAPQKNNTLIDSMVQKLQGILQTNQGLSTDLFGSSSPLGHNSSTNSDDLDGLPPLIPLSNFNIMQVDDKANVLNTGLIKVVRSMKTTMYFCLVSVCNFSSEDQAAFTGHCKTSHQWLSYTCDKCEACNKKVPSENVSPLLIDLFDHILSEHKEFLVPDLIRKPLLRTRRLSGDKLSVRKEKIEKTDELEPKEDEAQPTEGSDKVNAHETVILSNIEDETCKSSDQQSETVSEENPFGFKIADVVSLADLNNPPMLVPLSKKLENVESSPTNPPRIKTTVMLCETEMTLTELRAPKKSEEAMAKFLTCYRELFKCPVFHCKFTSNYVDMFNRHIKIHDISPDTLMPCLYCNWKTPIEHNAKHVEARHANCNFGCPFCLYRAVKKEFIALHIEDNHKTKPKHLTFALSLPPSKNNKYIIMAKPDPQNCKSYDCACGKSFLFQMEFAKHLKLCCQEPHMCMYEPCRTKKFAFSEYLNHITTMHSIRTFQCGYCPLSFSHAIMALSHHAAKHPTLTEHIYARRQPAVKGDFEYTTEAFKQLGVIQTRLFKRLSTIPLRYEVDFADSRLAKLETQTDNFEIENIGVASSSSGPPRILNFDIDFTCQPDLTRSLPSTEKSTATNVAPFPMSNLSDDSFFAQTPVEKDPLALSPEETIEMQAQNEISTSTSALPMNISSETSNDLGISVLPVATLSNETPNSSIISILPISTTLLEVTPIDAGEKELPQVPIEKSPTKTPLKDANLEKQVTNKVTKLSPAGLKKIRRSTSASGDDSDSKETETEKLKSGLAGKQLFKCFMCSEAFDNGSSFKDHITFSMTCRSVTSPSRPFICVHCERRFRNTAGLMTHIQYHGHLRFRCSLCNEKFAHSSQGKVHMKSRHSIQNIINVPLTPSKNDLEMDDFVLKPKTRQVEQPKPKESTTDESASISRDKKSYLPSEINQLPIRSIYSSEVKCAICLYATKVRTNLIRHLQFHVDEKDVPNSAPVNPVPCLDKNEKMFDKMTNLAISSFSSGASRMGGPKTTEGKEKEIKDDVPAYVPPHRRYVCSVVGCNYLCLEESNLRHHLLALHDEETSFTCTHCRRELHNTDADGVLKHLKLHDLHLYKCSHCSFVHNLKHKIDRHLTEHPSTDARIITVRALDAPPIETDPEDLMFQLEPVSTTPATSKWQKPWRCSMCKGRTATQEDMMSHVLNKHEIDSQFKCTLCTYKTNDDSTFEEHFKKSHQGHVVDFIMVFYKNDDTERTAIEDFDTTPLWLRDKPRVRHIRGILLDETSPAGKTKKSVSKSTPVPPVTPVAPSVPLVASSTFSNLDSAIEAVATGTADVMKDLSSPSVSDDIFEKINRDLEASKEDIARAKQEHAVISISDSEEEEEDLIILQPGEGKQMSSEQEIIERPVNEPDIIIDLEGSSESEKETEWVVDLEELKNKYGKLGSPSQMQFCCPLCGNFKTKKIIDFIHHMFRDLNYKRFECNFCHMRSVTHKFANQHIRKHNVGDIGITLLPINKEIQYWVLAVIRSQSQLMAGLNSIPVSVPNGSECKFCQDRFASSMDTHIHEVRHWMENAFHCGECGFKTDIDKLMLEHFGKEHPGKLISYKTNMAPTIDQYLEMCDEESNVTIQLCKIDQVLDPPVAPVVNKPSEGAHFYCTYCYFKGIDMETVQDHWFTDHQPMGIEFKYKKSKVIDSALLACHYCNAKGLDNELKVHHLTKHPLKTPMVYRFRCSLCPATFRRIDLFRTHGRRKHNTTILSYINVHGELVTQEKKQGYTCTVCQHEAPTTAAFKSHVRLHCRLFECRMCKTTFKYRHDATAHFSKDHPHSPISIEILKDKVKEYEDICLQVLGVKSNVKFFDDTNYQLVSPETIMVTSVQQSSQVAKKSTSKSAKPVLEEYSYYGSRPEMVNLENIITSLEVDGKEQIMNAQELGYFLDLSPKLLVEDCQKITNIAEFDAELDI